MFQWHFAEFKRGPFSFTILRYPFKRYKKLKETPWDFGHGFCPVLQHVATSCRFYQENLFRESGRTCLYFPRDHVHLRACRCSRFGTAGAVSPWVVSKGPRLPGLRMGSLLQTGGNSETFRVLISAAASRRSKKSYRVLVSLREFASCHRSLC